MREQFQSYWVELGLHARGTGPVNLCGVVITYNPRVNTLHVHDASILCRELTELHV